MAEETGVSPQTGKPAKKPRNRAYTDSSQLEQFMKLTGKTVGEMADALYQEHGTVYQWITRKRMPKLMLIALEGLRRRLGPNAKGTIYICTVPPSHDELFEQMLKLHSIKGVKLDLN